MTLRTDALESLGRLEITNLRKRIEKQDARKVRSQFNGKMTSYDADIGAAIVNIPEGGTVYAKSITTSSSETVAVNLPQNAGIGTIDAKPITSS